MSAGLFYLEFPMLQEERYVLRAIDPETIWLPSAARTASKNSDDFTNTTARGIIVLANVSAAPGVETIQFKVQGKDPLSGAYFDIAANTATTATGLIILKISPFLAAVAASASGHTANNLLPATWRLQAVHSASSSWTYSVEYSLTN
jgi:hypothetical protein